MCPPPRAQDPIVVTADWARHAVRRSHMPRTPGARLGPYRIERPLGAGGIGEVYRAADTRLGRTVAIKVLPDHLASENLEGPPGFEPGMGRP